jgi:hypothetical protein
MQPTHLKGGDNSSYRWMFDIAGDRRIPFQGKMRPGLVIVAKPIPIAALNPMDKPRSNLGHSMVIPQDNP